MAAARVLPIPAISEAVFCDQVIHLARMLRWRTAHFRPARTATGWRTAVSGDGKGFPDIIAVRGDRMLACELKIGRGKPTADQVEWLNAFDGVPAVEVHVWLPRDWDDIERTLR
jgi:hypothetical protein